MLKGLVSIGNPRVTGTERREGCAQSLAGAGGGRGTQGSHPWWFPELITGPPHFLPNTLSVVNWGGERKVIKTESLPTQPRNMNNRSIFSLSPKDSRNFTQ